MKAKSPIEECSDNLSLIFFVSGMWCGTCAKAVQAKVLNLSGVADAHLNFLTKLLFVVTKHDSCLSKLASDIEKEIDSLGYHALCQKEDWISRYVELSSKDREKTFSTVQFAITFFLAMWTSMFALARYLGGFPSGSKEAFALAIMSTVCGVPAILLGISPYAKASIKAIRSKRFTFDFIITIGACAAIILSILALKRGETEVFVDSAAMIVSILLLTKSLESNLVRKLTGRLTYQLSTNSSQLKIKRNDSWINGDETKVKVGQYVRYESGEIISLDGTLANESAEIAEDLLTGEASSKFINRGDEVKAGMMPHSRVELKVERTVGTRMIDGWLKNSLLVANRRDEGPLWIREIEKNLVFIAFVGPIFLALLSAFRGANLHTISEQLLIGVLLFCPCLVVSILPMVQLVTTNTLQHWGIIVTSNSALTRLAKVKSFFFDKTGTLFLAKTEWESIVRGDDTNLLRVLKLAKSASAHPLLVGLPIQSNEKDPSYQVDEVVGEGIALSSRVENIVIGRPRFLQKRNIYVPKPLCDTKPLIALNNQIIGRLLPQLDHIEKVNQGILRLISEFPDAVFQVLSGDPDRNEVEHVRALFNGKVKYRGDLTPQQKEETVKQFDNSIYVGDGLNDTAALNAADVSVRVGGNGSKLSEVDIYLMGGSIERLPSLIKYAKRSVIVVKETVGISFVYNFCAIALAANGWFTPLTAAGAMLLSFSLMVLSVLRLAVFKGYVSRPI